MRRLIGRTVVSNPHTGGTTTLEVGQELPDWAVDQVGDHLLDGEPRTRPAGSEPAHRPGQVVVTLTDQDIDRIADRLIEKLQAAADREAAGPPEPEPGPATERPAGNASEEKWRAYAIARGIPEADLADLGRDQIKEKVAALPPTD